MIRLYCFNSSDHNIVPCGVSPTRCDYVIHNMHRVNDGDCVCVGGGGGGGGQVAALKGKELWGRALCFGRGVPWVSTDSRTALKNILVNTLL